MSGAIGYVFDDRIEGWVRWLDGQVGQLVVKKSGIALTDVSTLIVKVERDQDGIVQHFQISGVPVTVEELRLGEARVESIDSEGVVRPLPLWDVLGVASQVAHFNERQIDALDTWVRLLGGVASIRSQNLSTRITTTTSDVVADHRSYGSISPDGDVIVGRNGYLFLGQGTNRVIDLYQEQSGDLPFRWASLAQERLANLSEMGVEYCQVIIPEKSSVLHWLCPFEVSGRSYVLRDVLGCCEEKLGSRLVCPEFSDSKNTLMRQFQLGDSHLGSAGAEVVVDQVLRALKINRPKWTVSSKFELLLGDLATRYSGDNKEYVELYKMLNSKGELIEPELVEAEDPTEGHRGMRRVWRCSLAPLPYTVVAMANSFFERGGASTQLSWWFSRLFREFHFCWSPELDYEYIQKAHPDYVVCQTIERFLRSVPIR